MIPVVTPAEMKAIDHDATEPIEVLIDRAGRAVARAVIRRLGGVYGRRVVVVAGPGHNGADGRVAAAVLARRGVRVEVVEATTDATLPRADLVVDAAFGTGLARPFDFPMVPPSVPVLAVDIPSGVDGLTGEAHGRVAAAVETVTFVALKPGLLHEPGRSLAGALRVEPVAGLAADRARVHVAEAADVAGWVPARDAVHHKWRSAVRIVGGSVSMTGAVELAAAGALRLAGHVEVAVPGEEAVGRPREAVARPLPCSDWGSAAVADIDRFGAVLAGPGLADVTGLERLLDVDNPLVLDASALRPDLVPHLRRRRGPTVVTPHDGEFRRLGGSDDPDRIAATRALARDLGVVVLRKGPTTIVAAPEGDVRVVTNGGPALATAGTGDVLAGVIAALVARGAPLLDAATAGAWLHAEAARDGPGLVASDLPGALPAVLGRLGG